MFVGHRIDSVTCERNKDPEEIKEYTRGYDFNIEGRELKSINVGKRKMKVLRIGYSLTINYAEDIGAIRIKGSIEYEDTPKRLKEIESGWDEEADLQTMVFNSIFSTAIPLVMDISRHVGLPSPIPIPVFARDDVNKSV